MSASRAGADGATGVEHVVDEHDDLAGDVDGDLGGADGLHRAEPDVVAEEGDVERAHRHLGALEPVDRGGDPAGDGQAPRVEADEDDVVRAMVALDDLVRDAGVGPAEIVGVEHAGAEHVIRRCGALPFRMRRGGHSVTSP